MPQVWQVVLCVALLRGAVLAADFTVAQAEVAREGLQEALDKTLTKFSKVEDLDLPPYIRQTVRTTLGISVETVKQATNIKLSGLPTLHRGGALGLDPLVAGKTVTFTLPLQIDQPKLTGEFTRKVAGVGPSGNFTTTIGVLRLEAEGMVTVSPEACSFNFTSVKDIEVSGVDTTMEGTTVAFNSLLASKVTEAINEKKLGVGEPVSRFVLTQLQLGDGVCTSNVRDRLKTVPAAAA